MLQVTIKLFATLATHLPADAAKNMASLEIPPQTTINQLINQLKLPRELVHLVLLNGIFVAEQDRDRLMSAGDTLAIWPPVAGG